MGIQTEKLELIKHVLDTDDEGVLQELKAIFKNHEKDFWNKLPEHIKSGIERASKQAGAGLLTPVGEVMKKYAEYLCTYK